MSIEEVLRSSAIRGASKLFHDISQKIKDKIWANEYIDLQVFINDDHKLTPITFAYSESGEKITYEAKKRDTPITNWCLWLKPFFTFATVCLSKFPNKGPELFAYTNYIVEQAQVHPWPKIYGYKIDFQKSLQDDPHRRWDVTDMQLLCDNLGTHILAGSTNPFKRKDWQLSKHTSTPDKEDKIDEPCKKYNHGTCTYGNKCHYQHKCLLCSCYYHPAKYCKSKKPAKCFTPPQFKDSPHKKSKSD